MTNRVARAWVLAWSRLLWGWRFHAFGARAVVGRCRLSPMPGSVRIGHHTILGDDWSLVDLQPARRSDDAKIRIGSYCTILHDFQCNASVSVEVQDYVLIAPRVFITDSDHVVGNGEHTTLCREFRSAPVTIEHDCWLGVNSVILKGVKVGHHSIVGANAVVTRDVPPFSTVAGIPAKVIGTVHGRQGAGAAVSMGAGPPVGNSHQLISSKLRG